MVSYMFGFKQGKYLLGFADFYLFVDFIHMICLNFLSRKSLMTQPVVFTGFHKIKTADNMNENNKLMYSYIYIKEILR